MEKDFDDWNDKKKRLHFEGSAEFYHEREIWWCSLGINIGDEQDGTGENFDRPIVIIKGFNKKIFFGIALTGKKKAGDYYFPVGQIGGQEATAVLSQVRLLDSKRLVKKIGMLDETIFKGLKQATRDILFG